MHWEVTAFLHQRCFNLGEGNLNMPKLSAVRLTKRIVEDARPGAFISDAVLRGFGLMVTPAGTKCFVVSYRKEAGGQGRQVIGHFPADTVEQARIEAQQRLSGVKAGKDPASTRRTLRAIPTVSVLAETYVGDYARARHLRDSTVRDARTVLRYALATLGARKVCDVTTTEIRTLHGRVAHEVSRYQANRMLAVLKRMFGLSIEHGWQTTNPCQGLGKFPEDQRWRNLSESEVAGLLGACRAYPDQNAANVVRLLLFTGARLREVLSAQWDQFDLERGLWEKPSAHTKTRRQHRVELEGPALHLLREMHGKTNCLYLFPGKPIVKAGGAIVLPPRADLKRPWRWLCKAAGLSDIRLHDLRRTTASFMLNGGASLATIGKTLGHTQAATTARYAHLSGTVQREELRRAGERMAALGGGSPTTDSALNVLATPSAGRFSLFLKTPPRMVSP
jgi:integrase